METVNAFAPGCPVILALNKADINPHVSVNEKDLRARNPALKLVLKTYYVDVGKMMEQYRRDRKFDMEMRNEEAKLKNTEADTNKKIAEGEQIRTKNWLILGGILLLLILFVAGVLSFQDVFDFFKNR